MSSPPSGARARHAPSRRAFEDLRQAGGDYGLGLVDLNEPKVLAVVFGSGLGAFCRPCSRLLSDQATTMLLELGVAYTKGRLSFIILLPKSASALV